MKRRLLSLALAALMVLSLVAMSACAPTASPSSAPPSAAPTQKPTDKPSEAPAVEATPEPEVGSTPRNETVYINGLAWGAPTNFSPISGNQTFPLDAGAGRNLTYETLFGYNMLDGKMYGVLGQSYEWTDDYTLTIKLYPNAHWNDGQPLTAKDVAYTYGFAKTYTVSWTSIWDYLESAEAADDQTVVLKLNKDNYNRLQVLNSLQNMYVLPEHVLKQWESETGNDITKMKQIFNENPVGSGPYKIFYYDETKITLIRDDNYWGVAGNKDLTGGKLAAPKYITHPIFSSNDAGDLAFKSGEVDISQQFIAQVWKLWEDGTPISTYLSELPYYLPASMPSIFINASIPGLDVLEVRKAIAMSIDYEKIGELAMSGYTAKIVPSIVLMTSEAEKAYIDTEANASLRWSYDVDGANALLDSIGAAPGPDGIRVLNGTRLGPWKVECPYGWTDWNASLEIVMQSAAKIGIELQTEFPEAPVWTNHLQTGDFDIIMNTPAGSANPAQPWQRVRDIMYSKGVAARGEQAFWNWERFHNDRANELIEAIPAESDMAKLKEMYTELEKIYLENIPSIPLMYRPGVFHTVNETHWTGYPKMNDGSNIPPTICVDRWGIKALYNLTPVNP